ncbi:MAG TPA: TetR/AcrR family transcriptional regulator [Aquabacterium sp.]|uniref:TetR/AcrR family transcriptional regulator n=1 Tax=Aquabacterium sp. TaxID=1872578 RepID=UPI002E36131E|nr:TetR/AcrR family transcriptional regulator [Aquabacterium sp.]HEX5374516.1 TetR/AcrR family transcriptional regulator [Aquabacterium sp.]
MRYSKTHKEETRRKLIDSSRALVKKNGFDATGVDTLMSSVGLTAGAFYSHFPSKQALLEEVVREEIQHSVSMLKPQASDGSLATLGQRTKAYLSVLHAEHPEAGCVLPALGAELGRIPPEVKSIVEDGLKEMHSVWYDELKDENAAWAAIAQCVGAVILARSVKSDATRREILRANRAHIEALVQQHTPKGD